MKGYRTIILNGVGIIVALAAGFGVILSPEQVTEIVLGGFALANVFLRFDTDSKVGEK